MPPINAGNSMARWTAFPHENLRFSWKIQASHAHRYKYGMPKNAGGSSKRASLKGKWLVLAFGISIF